MYTLGTSGDLPTLRRTVYPFASQSEGTITTVYHMSVSSSVSERDGDCRFVHYYHLARHLFVDFGIPQAISRSDLRRRYGIRGDAFNDVLTSGCCVPCELVQEHREIQLEESSFY